jgi:hypothetical protein
MDEHRITRLLRLKSSEVPERTRFCPDDECITEYFEGTLDDQKRTDLKRHLIDCRFCMARVGNLERLADEGEPNRVPGTVLADAKGLVTQTLPVRTRHSSAWAAAALVVLTLSAITMLGIPPGKNLDVPSSDVQHNPSHPRPSLHRQLRSLDPSALKPRIISPVDGASIGSGELEIRWTGVSGSLHYDIQLVNAEGFIVHHDRVEDVTEWQPVASNLLEAGKTYYIRVDAYLAEANSVSSDHILFTVEENRQ